MKVPAIPTSTYRLQFSSLFRFSDATRMVPYLAKLGIDMMYASPYFRARPGSTHGYDVVDHNSINPEIGTPEEHTAMIGLAQQHGIGHLLDFVPNHMGIGQENPWWRDVLTWGESSPYAHYFDIDWRSQNTDAHGRVILPQLGDLYGDVLERGELQIAYLAESAEFVVKYFEKNFPLRLQSYVDVLEVVAAQPEIADGDLHQAMERLCRNFQQHGGDREKSSYLKAELKELCELPPFRRALEKALESLQVGKNSPQAADRLDEILRHQYYRLSYFRLARDQINYRRFFDVNDLAGLRIENIDVLGDTHTLLFELIDRGLVQGVRIDHIDGLRQPASYCRILRDQHLPAGQRLYLVLEKILARYESLHSSWGADGTTGYEFSAMLCGLSVDQRAEERFSRIYQSFSGLERDFRAIAQEAKRLVIRTMLASELTVLATMLQRIAACDRRSVDFTFTVLYDALTEVVAGFPVYRTYVMDGEPSSKDLEYIDWAIKLALKSSPPYDEKVYGFIRDVLSLKILSGGGRYVPEAIIAFVEKFQQYTSPVMAKSVEDTAFYRYVRLLSLNEVGGDPARFGISVYDFHRFCSDRAERMPCALSATATHDHKRGEDVRTRLNALTEMPELWRKALTTFHRYSERMKPFVHGVPAPSANDEYALYQTLLGTWPCEWLDGVPSDAEQREPYAARIEQYTRKFLREAKLRTSWVNVDEAYEKATIDFARRLLDPERAAPFQKPFLQLTREAARLGMLSSLIGLAIKHTAPGVPDLYQGGEFWDLSLVDPDNRRPVDFAMREEVLRGFEQRLATESKADIYRELLTHWADGRIKFFLLWQLLQFRRTYRDSVLSSDYRQLRVVGRRSKQVLAFARRDVVVVAPRLLRRLAPQGTRIVLQDTAVLIPKPASAYVDVLTGERVTIERGRLRTADLFTTLPFAILVASPESAS